MTEEKIKYVYKLSKDPEKAKKQKLSYFKKGNKKAQGHGRPKLTKEQKELSLKNRTDFKNILNKYMQLDASQIEELLHERKLPAIDMMVLRNLLNTINSGDPTKVDWALNHIVGKEKETTNINLTGGMQNTSSVDVNSLTKEQAIALKDIVKNQKKKK